MKHIFPGLLCLLFSLALNSGTASETVPSYDAQLSGFEYPFPVRYHHLSSQRQELEMAYMYLPADTSKPLVILLHGKNFSGFYWEDTALHLNKKGYPVLIPDQIGFGKSSKPRHYQFTFEGLATNTKALVDTLEHKETIIVGHSMGGMLATRYSLMFPEAVNRLVLVNPIGLEDYLQYAQYKDPDFFYASELKQTIEGVREYQRKNYYDGKWSDQYEALLKAHQGWLNGPDWELVAWNNALTYDLIFTGSVVNEFHKLSMPVSLIIGTRDRTGPGRGWMKPGIDYELGQYQHLGKQTADMIPDSTLYELEDIGHVPQYEAPERYKEILDEIF